MLELGVIKPCHLKMACWFILGIAVPASATPPSDSTYVHCRSAGGDFRISELNHSVSQFSDRYQEYRPVCRECDIVEWGDRITMRDGDKTFVQVNRLTGDISVQRNGAKDGGGPFDVHSFHGTCAKGTRVAPNGGQASGGGGRAF